MDDRGALEKRCGLAVTVGSNPTLSAAQNQTGSAWCRPRFHFAAFYLPYGVVATLLWPPTREA